LVVYLIDFATFVIGWYSCCLVFCVLVGLFGLVSLLVCFVVCYCLDFPAPVCFVRFTVARVLLLSCSNSVVILVIVCFNVCLAFCGLFTDCFVFVGFICGDLYVVLLRFMIWCFLVICCLVSFIALIFLCCLV